MCSLIYDILNSLNTEFKAFLLILPLENVGKDDVATAKRTAAKSNRQSKREEKN